MSRHHFCLTFPGKMLPLVRGDEKGVERALDFQTQLLMWRIRGYTEKSESVSDMKFARS